MSLLLVGGVLFWAFSVGRLRGGGGVVVVVCVCVCVCGGGGCFVFACFFLF